MIRTTILGMVAVGAMGAGLLAGAGGAAADAPGSGALDSGSNFSEPDGSQSIAGNLNDCVTVTLPRTGSFQSFGGTVTMWTGKNCNTGKFLVVNSSVADLKAQGFGQTMSVFIGNNAQQNGGPSGQTPGVSAILDSGPNFSEPDGSQSLNGNVGDVQNVNLPQTGSIQFTTPGTITLYTGPNATGKKVELAKDNTDLASIGFGKTRSVRIGPAA